MKHVKALVVKALMIWAIVWIVLSFIYDVAFMDSTIVGVIIVVMLYALGITEYRRKAPCFSCGDIRRAFIHTR